VNPLDKTGVMLSNPQNKPLRNSSLVGWKRPIADFLARLQTFGCFTPVHVYSF